MGFSEPIDYRRGDIPYLQNETLDQSCYDAIKACHILAVILGRRYGSKATLQGFGMTFDESEEHTTHDSVVKVEYLTARSLGLQVYVFVPSQILTDYQYYRQDLTAGGIRAETYRNVDDINVLHFIHEMMTHPKAPPIDGFNDPSNISDFLRKQWAGLLRVHFERERQKAAEERKEVAV